MTLTLRLLEIADRPAWDRLTQVTGSFMQSWAWGEFKALEGFRVMRVGVFAPDRLGKFKAGMVQAERLVGGATFYYYPRPQRANLLLATGGPCFEPGYEGEGMALLVAQAQVWAREWGAIALRVEPMVPQMPVPQMPVPQMPNLGPGFVRASVDVLPVETLWIDLKPSPTEILAAMQPKGRYNIRLSQRHGVTTEFTTDSQAIPQFYNIFWDTVQRQGFFGEPYRFFINLCQVLFQNNMAEIGFSTYQGETLATMLILYWGDRATYFYGGRRPEHPAVMAPYGLHWAAMQRARARGCEVYDFYGFTQKLNHSYTQFSRFKRQFGGQPVRMMGAQDYYFYDRLADTLAQMFESLTPTAGNNRS
jgi:peptidoglycan pentaglycine glycine transferase (the first glycine)